MSADEVLDWIRERHGLSYTLVRRLHGGFQGGAYLVEAPDLTRAVVKWSSRRSWAPQVLRAEPVVRRVRERGYPTPAWLAAGVTGPSSVGGGAGTTGAPVASRFGLVPGSARTIRATASLDGAGAGAIV